MNVPIENHGASSRRIGWLAIACLVAAFAAFVAYSSKQLPEHVATHFDLHGKPNGWMTRAQHLKFSIGVGVGTPLFILGVFALVAKMKGWGLNIPNKQFWLAPERQQATFDFLRAHSFWLAGLMIVFHAALFQSIVLANSQKPAFLPSAQVVWLIGGFVAFLLVWIVILLRRFRRPSA